MSKLQKAYEDLVAKTRYADVKIADLAKTAGVPVDALQEWIMPKLGGRYYPTAIPSRGEWLYATEEERAAAITVNGQPHMYVRLEYVR